MNISPPLNMLLLILATIVVLYILLRYFMDWRISATFQDKTELGALVDSLVLPWARDRFGHTALHVAAERGDEEKCRELIARGADPNAQGGGEWGTPLHWAMRSANYAVCALLINNGADVNATCGHNPEGATPLDELDRCLKFGRNPDWHIWRHGQGVEEELIPVYRQIEELLIRHGGKRNF